METGPCCSRAVAAEDVTVEPREGLLTSRLPGVMRREDRSGPVSLQGRPQPYCLPQANLRVPPPPVAPWVGDKAAGTLQSHSGPSLGLALLPAALQMTQKNTPAGRRAWPGPPPQAAGGPREARPPLGPLPALSTCPPPVPAQKPAAESHCRLHSDPRDLEPPVPVQGCGPGLCGSVRVS